MIIWYGFTFWATLYIAVGVQYCISIFRHTLTTVPSNHYYYYCYHVDIVYLLRLSLVLNILSLLLCLVPSILHCTTTRLIQCRPTFLCVAHYSYFFSRKSWFKELHVSFWLKKILNQNREVMYTTQFCEYRSVRWVLYSLATSSNYSHVKYCAL